MSGGILSGGILERGDIVRGDFVLGGYCPGGYCPGDIVRGDIVRGDIVLIPGPSGEYRKHATPGSTPSPRNMSNHIFPEHMHIKGRHLLKETCPCLTIHFKNTD